MRLLAVIEIAAWTDLAPTRFNQTFRNEMASHLRLMADRISNCQQDGGPGWKIEPSPIEKSTENEAA
jgi:hypothetical protein